jgi:MinD-like ATPase involved in chromosome partitioning or flagellar assembly
MTQPRPVVHEPRSVPNEFGPAEVAERVWRSAAALLPGASVAVSSADGGVGRSTLVSALGGLFALAVPGPVAAVDMVPVPWGGLGERVGRQNSGTVWDTVRDLHTLTSRHEIERWAQRGPTGLLALVGETEGHVRRPPRHDEAAAVVDQLRAMYPLTVCDVLPALITGVWRTLATATAPVLVSRATTDSLRHTMRLLTHMRAAGYGRVARDGVLVVMATSPTVPREVRAVASQAAEIAGAVLTVPYDPQLAKPEPIDPRRLHRRTRTALVRVADAVLQQCAAERPPAPLHQAGERA